MNPIELLTCVRIALALTGAVVLGILSFGVFFAASKGDTAPFIVLSAFAGLHAWGLFRVLRFLKLRK